MAGTHGDLFAEIGHLVMAANAGQALDLAATSEELSQRYANLNVPPDTMARAIARSLGAVGVSVAMLRRSGEHSSSPEPDLASHWSERESFDPGETRSDKDDASPRSLFPSGVRLSLLS